MCIARVSRRLRKLGHCPRQVSSAHSRGGCTRRQALGLINVRTISRTVKHRAAVHVKTAGVGHMNEYICATITPQSDEINHTRGYLTVQRPLSCIAAQMATHAAGQGLRASVHPRTRTRPHHRPITAPTTPNRWQPPKRQLVSTASAADALGVALFFAPSLGILAYSAVRGKGMR